MGKITYENQDYSSFLVYQLELPEKLDQLAMEMLANNSMEGIISPVLLQKDGVTFLRYNITSKVTLASYFRDAISRQHFLTSLFSVVAAMKLAEEYMLETSSFLLDTEHIFVNVASSKTDMIYLPTENAKTGCPTLIEFAKELLVAQRFDPSENTAYVAQILNYCNSAGFTLAGFHALLKELLDSDTVRSKPVTPTSVHAGSVPLNAPAGPGMPLAPPPQPPPYPYANMAAHMQPAAPPEPMEPKKKKFSLNLFSSNKKPKAKKEKEKPMWMSTGFAIPGRTPPSVNPSAGLPQAPPAMPIAAPTPPIAPPTAPPMQPAAVPVAPAAPPAEPYAPAPMHMPQQPAIVPPVRTAAPVAPQNSFGSTMVLDQASGATTVLTNEEMPAAAPKFILVREKTGERIELEKTPYRIGKERSYVDYCITDNSTISRSHADLLIENGVCYVVDNNSTNHTYVGGQMLTSNTKTPLQDGVQVVFSNEYFVFQIR